MGLSKLPQTGGTSTKIPEGPIDMQARFTTSSHAIGMLLFHDFWVEASMCAPRAMRALMSRSGFYEQGDSFAK